MKKFLFEKRILELFGWVDKICGHNSTTFILEMAVASHQQKDFPFWADIKVFSNKEMYQTTN